MVDRPLHPNPKLSSPPPPPPAVAPSGPFAPPPPSPNPPIDRPFPSSSAAAASSSRSSSFEFLFPSVPQSRALGSSYYHHYGTPVGKFPGSDDSLEPFLELEGFDGVGVGPWSGPLDGEELERGKGRDGGSSWMDPSLGYQVSSFPKGAAAEGFIAYGSASDVWREKHVNSLTRRLHCGLENFEWPHDKHPAVYGEKATAAARYNNSETPVLSRNALLKGVPHSQLSDSVSVVESCDAFNSNSSYDRYMEQLGSCLTNPMAYYPAKTYSTSAQVYEASSARGTGSTMDYSLSRKGYVTVRHGDPYKINDDYAGNTLTLTKEPHSNQNLEGKERNDEKIRANSNLKMYSGLTEVSFPMEKGLPSGHASAAENFQDHSSVLKSGLTKTSKISTSPFSEFGSGGPDDSMQNSSETVDHAVDSPCWKGASASRQSPFGVGEIEGLRPVVMESKGCNDLDIDQKHLPSSFGCSDAMSFSKQVEELVCDEGKKDSSISHLSIQQKPEDCHIIGSDCVKDRKAKGIQCSGIYNEQGIQVTNNQWVKSGDKDNEAEQLDPKESAVYANRLSSPDGPNPVAALKAAQDSLSLWSAQDSLSVCHPCTKDNFMDSSFTGATTTREIAEQLDSSVLSSKPSPLAKDAQLLVKTMHNLSEVFLSSYYSNASDLKDHDHELIQLVIDNLQTFTLKSRKDVAKGNFCASALEAVQPQVTGLKVNAVMNPSNINNMHGMMGKMQSVGSNSNSDMLNNSVFSGGASNFCGINGMSQAFENILEKSIGENPQAQLYKNLWVEAEVTLCSMKYELQLARMKTQIENHKHQTEGFGMKPQQATRFSSPDSSVLNLSENEAPQKAKEVLLGEMFTPLADAGEKRDRNLYEALPPSSSRTMEEVDASVMARLRVLKRRDDLLDSMNMEKQQTLDSLDFAEVHSGTEENVPSFMQDIPQPSTKGGLKSTTSVGKNTKEEIGEGSNISQMLADRIVHSCNSGGSMMQSCILHRHGKHFPSGGNDSSSSEWEHVLKEELS